MHYLSIYYIYETSKPATKGGFMKHLNQFKLVTLTFIAIFVVFLFSDFRVDFRAVKTTAATRTLTKSQQKNADRIAEVVASKWDDYGVLPSVAVAQAFIESTLGDRCPGYNLWGINSGRGYNYSSLDEGINAYLKVIHDSGYYDDAIGCKSYATQLYRILYDVDSNGNRRDVYCVPAGDYLSDAKWAIEAYGFDKYDKKMFKEIEKKKEEARQQRIFERKEKKRKAKWSKEYTMVYDSSVAPHEVVVNANIIKKGTVSIYYGYDLQGIYDVRGGESGYEIATSDLSLVGKTVTIEVCENAVG